MRLGAITLERSRQVLAQHGQVELGALQAFKLLGQLLPALYQPLGRHAILASKLFNRSQPALNLVLASRIDIQRFAIVLQRAGCLGDLNRGFLQDRHDGGQLRVYGRESAQRLQGATHARMRTAFLALKQLLQSSLRPLGKTAAVRQP